MEERVYMTAKEMFFWALDYDTEVSYSNFSRIIDRLTDMVDYSSTFEDFCDEQPNIHYEDGKGYYYEAV